MASTSPPRGACFDVARPWHLARDVSLRDEPFGALAYHHGNRRLVFLKSSTLVELVRRLGEFDSAAEALATIVAPHEQARFESALATLAAGELLGAG